MKNKIGIIGGSGLYGIEGVEITSKQKIYTPFGSPSDELLMGKIKDKEVVFLPRHGKGHKKLPSEINYRANIWALKKVGVNKIISVSAVGSLKEQIRPLDIVLIDQYYDRTKFRENTFFGNGIIAHIDFSQPICFNLRRTLYEVGQEVGEGTKMHFGGTYCNIEGPAFSTKAESMLYKSWGFDVVGMTNLPEAKLAREAEICYATMAMVTDYDCWKDGEECVNVDMVIANISKNAEVAKKIIKNTIMKIPEQKPCECNNALNNAILTPLDKIPSEVQEKLNLILSKYINK
ncbi:MAG: S-methyl-5'-thioadenosine phosphorylase [bacterium]